MIFRLFFRLTKTFYLLGFAKILARERAFITTSHAHAIDARAFFCAHAHPESAVNFTRHVIPGKDDESVVFQANVPQFL